MERDENSQESTPRPRGPKVEIIGDHEAMPKKLSDRFAAAGIYSSRDLDRAAGRLRESLLRVESPPKRLGYIGPRKLDTPMMQALIPRSASADDIAEVRDELR